MTGTVETTGTAEQGTLEYAAEQLLAPADNESDTDTLDTEDRADDLDDGQEQEYSEQEDSGDDDLGDDGEDDTDDSEEEDEGNTEDDSDPEGDADDDTDAEPTYTVTVDGKERNVTLQELKRGYSGQQYIQEGMEQVAGQRREVEQVYSALTQERQQLQSLIGQLSTGGLPTQPVAPQQEQFQNDPIGYMEAQTKYNADLQQYQQQVSQLQQVVQQNSQAQQLAREAYLKSQVQQLVGVMPEIKSVEKLKSFLDSITSAGEKYGYSADELSAVDDHRALLVLRDAAKWRALQEKRGTAQADAEQRPRRGQGKGKTLRPGAASKRKSSARSKARQQKREQLRQTGSVDAAVDLILQGPD